MVVSPQLTGGGLLAAWAGVDRVKVNLVHGQGINRLASGLRVEARADDGLVDAARSDDHAVVLGVQWHPEWRVTEHFFHHRIFQVFGDACRRYSCKADRS